MPEKKVKSKQRRKMIEITRMNMMFGVLMGILGSNLITTLFRLIDYWNMVELYRFIVAVVLIFVVFFVLNKVISKQLDKIDEIVND
jgi:uncharacterized membrane protein YeaQ/YmgE (transglycosylase-associated protein family)